MQNVSFIGLGIMGSRMAKHLIGHSHLTVYNRTASAADGLVEAGAQRAETLAGAVKEAHVVFTMLSKPSVVEQVAWGADGFLAHMPKGSLWVDCSTVDPAFTLEAAKAAAAAGVRYLEAPVAGSKPPAEAGELVFFAGGQEADVQEATPYMNLMGKKVLPAGPVGKGASLKILVNSLLAQSWAVFSETLLLGEKMGLDREFLLNFLPGLPVTPGYVPSKAAMVKAGEYETQFPLEWMHKDLTLLTKTAEALGVAQPMATTAEQLYGQANEGGYARHDFAALYEHLKV